MVGERGRPRCRADDPPWVGREIAFVRDVLARGIPYLGICMGCQILAGACGGDVGGRADGLCEFGFFPVEPTAEGASLFRDSRCFYQAHYEGVMALPAGAVLLATGENFPVQAFRVGENAYGLQFHPDARFERLTPDAIASDSLIGVEGRQGVDEQMFVWRIATKAAIQRWTEEFVDRLDRPGGQPQVRCSVPVGKRSGSASLTQISGVETEAVCNG